MKISFTLNSEKITADVAPNVHLVDYLREEQGLLSLHLGCEQGSCGACNVLIDNKSVRGCLTLAVQAEGLSITTLEGLSDIKDLQEAFLNRNSLQCGFCTPGMLITAKELLDQNRLLTREEIREAISGNYCRCTGYQAIVDAIETVNKGRQNA